jgi:hypothetical protein
VKMLERDMLGWSPALDAALVEVRGLRCIAGARTRWCGGCGGWHWSRARRGCREVRGGWCRVCRRHCGGEGSRVGGDGVGGGIDWELQRPV